MRMSVDFGRMSLSSLDLPDDPLPPTPSQKDLIHKLHESKRLKDEYYDKYKKTESRLLELQQELSTLKNALEKSPRPAEKSHDLNQSTESASVYAFNTLSKELSKITKIFTKQETLFKKCIQSSESHLTAYSKLQDKVNDYITVCKASDLHIQKIMNQNLQDKSSVSDAQKTERLLMESPSLFDELKEFEEDVPAKHENAILVSEAHIAKINNFKAALEHLKEEIKHLGQAEAPKDHFSKDFLVNSAVRKSISLFNF